MGRPRAPHGTKAAYKRHLADKSRICDACQAWRDGETPPKPVVSIPRTPESSTEPPKPAKERLRMIDPLEETLDNLDAIKDAIAWARAEDPSKLGPLSKRKSELIAEIIAYGGEFKDPEQKPKMEQILDGPTPSEVSTLGDNVLGFRPASAGA